MKLSYCLYSSQVAFRTVQHALIEKQHKLKKLLDIPDEETKAEHAQDIQDRITDYFRHTGARLKIDSVKRVSLKIFLTFQDIHQRYTDDVQLRIKR